MFPSEVCEVEMYLLSLIKFIQWCISSAILHEKEYTLCDVVMEKTFGLPVFKIKNCTVDISKTVISFISVLIK